MKVETEDMLNRSGDGFLVAHPRRVARSEVLPHRVEEKSARTTRGVEDSLLERVVNNLSHHSFSKPIWRVVLAEVLALLRVDDALVEMLEHVVLYR